jgi:8-oxo-dGTP pyrophosphatase MutT (NUDIX family)
MEANPPAELAQAGDGKEPRQQFGAICWRAVKPGNGYEMLLVTTRGTGRWVVPKGWPIKDKAPYKAAEQEALEEAGVRGKADRRPVGTYTYAKQLPDGRVVPCMVEVYAIKVDKLVRNFKEQGQRERKWVSFAEAESLVEEPDLRGLIIRLDAKLRNLAFPDH